MAETCELGRAGSVSSSRDASAHAGSVNLGHVYVLGSRGCMRAPSRAGMAHGADPLGHKRVRVRVGQAASVSCGNVRESVGVVGSVG
jgi:hypothetical protein